jgi:excisionase family DNA binding protein
MIAQKTEHGLEPAVLTQQPAPASADPWESFFSLIDEKQVAEVLNCSEATVTRLRLSGALSFVRVGRLIRFRQSDLAQYFERHAQSPAAATA